MLAPKVSCNWVCLNKLFNTTLATASFLNTTTMRIPVREDESSLKSEMPVTFPVSTSSAIFSFKLSGLT